MRLIDADTLEKDLKSVTLSNGTLINTSTMIALINKYPTAYDIDKVIEELEGLRKVDMCESGDCPYEDTLCCDCTQYRMLDKAIEIVNQFGVGKKVEE